MRSLGTGDRRLFGSAPSVRRALAAAVAASISCVVGTRKERPVAPVRVETTATSRASTEPPCLSRSCLRTLSRAVAKPHIGQVAVPLLIVPGPALLTPSPTVKLISRFVASGTIFNVTEALPFFASQRDLSRGMSAPQPGPSHRTTRAHKYAIGVSPLSDG